MKHHPRTDNGFSFSTITPVRITDINYGNHLGHIGLIGMFHNARVLFLNQHGFDEMNISGAGLILLNSTYSFIKETFFNTTLHVSVGINELSKSRLCFLYKATDQKTGVDVANGQEEFAYFNYEKRKIMRISGQFLDFCKNAQKNSCSP